MAVLCLLVTELIASVIIVCLYLSSDVLTGSQESCPCWLLELGTLAYCCSCSLSCFLDNNSHIALVCGGCDELEQEMKNM